MATIEASSFKFKNNGSTIFTFTKPGGLKDTIHPSQKQVYSPKGVYSADIDGVQAFTINFTTGNINISKGTDDSPSGTSAKITTILN
ncbi:hypothetical protein NLJ89_g10686 [Agrocybe chaxingu]|uniref:Uncharacterized protein n=1 Tax=Agrocybe chaxingu TaxID=84603 RepID=A0A9W8JNE0_9AGAR|nr:hypothetical protein NLJ89_g10686 [Agrocybe chaxingu]